ncbi:MAG TPA: hypothetical protein VF659_19645 [Pyrinomonadaceae bacterium]|jgi:hypothetical protein
MKVYRLGTRLILGFRLGCVGLLLHLTQGFFRELVKAPFRLGCLLALLLLLAAGCRLLGLLAEVTR